MKKFDSIRPYQDHEVESVIYDLCNDKDVIKTIKSLKINSAITKIPFLEKFISLYLRYKTKDIKSISDYQKFFETIVVNVVKTTIDDLKVSGLDNLDPNKGYLFISNHRDITLDSALLNLSLHQNGFTTTKNAVGNNLMNEKWASDLMRLNKSFIIDRSEKSKKDIYKSLQLVSEFISESILKNNESIWIAQKQGRSKDGVDYTDPAVLKMIHLYSRKEASIKDFFNKISVIPVSVSYEKDPNDILKAKELYLTAINSVYIKEPREDLMSISDGITGKKGNVNISIGNEMRFQSDSYDDIAHEISKTIKDSYYIHPTNIASCIIQGIKYPEHSFSNEEIDSAMEYLNKRMHIIQEDMHPFLLSQYSNSVL